ncbi:MAG: hypothetical protein QXU97_03480 [Fervidicoccaceae archaeon]
MSDEVKDLYELEGLVLIGEAEPVAVESCGRGRGRARVVVAMRDGRRIAGPCTDSRAAEKAAASLRRFAALVKGVGGGEPR